jgi:hypothetical protein
LKIEAHATLKQARPFATPVSKEMPVRALTRLVAVGTTERFVLLSLGLDRKCKKAKPAPEKKYEAFSWLLDTALR